MITGHEPNNSMQRTALRATADAERWMETTPHRLFWISQAYNRNAT